MKVLSLALVWKSCLQIVGQLAQVRKLKLIKKLQKINLLLDKKKYWLYIWKLV